MNKVFTTNATTVTNGYLKEYIVIDKLILQKQLKIENIFVVAILYTMLLFIATLRINNLQFVHSTIHCYECETINDRTNLQNSRDSFILVQLYPFQLGCPLQSKNLKTSTTSEYYLKVPTVLA